MFYDSKDELTNSSTSLKPTNQVQLGEMDREKDEDTEQQFPEKTYESFQTTTANVVVEINDVVTDEALDAPYEQGQGGLSPHSSNIKSLDVETSPSFRSLHPGYVSNIAEFWENIWKIENNQKLGVQRETRDRQFGEEGVINDDKDDEINRLQETIVFQCQLLRATEEENRALKEKIANNESMNEKILRDLNRKSERRENLVIDMRAKVGEYVKEIRELKEKDLLKTNKLSELEDKLSENSPETNILRNENIYLKDKVKEVASQLCDVEFKNRKLEDELTNYEKLVKDLKKQIVPMENIKQKMASLDDDVFVLKRRLQGSMRSKKKEHKSDNAMEMNVLEHPKTSTKKRRISSMGEQVMSPAKVMKISKANHGAKDSIDEKVEESNEYLRVPKKIETENEHVRMRSFKKSRSRIGQECQPQ